MPEHQCTYCSYSDADGHVVVAHEAEMHQAGLKPLEDTGLESKADDRLDRITDHFFTNDLRLTIKSHGKHFEVEGAGLSKLKAAIEEYVREADTHAMLREATHRANDALDRLLRIDREYLVKYLQEYLHNLRSNTPGEGES